MIPKNDHLSPRSTPLAEGDAAPDFTLWDQNKKEWKLSEAVKKGDVVLCFYPLSFTGTCGIEMKCVSTDIAKWQAKGAQVVGISCDSFAVQKEWSDKEGLKQPLLADMLRQVCKAYGFYWADLNTTARGTVVIGKNAEGRGKVKWAQKREIPQAMNFDEVLAAVS